MHVVFFRCAGRDVPKKTVGVGSGRQTPRGPSHLCHPDRRSGRVGARRDRPRPTGRIGRCSPRRRIRFPRLTQRRRLLGRVPRAVAATLLEALTAAKPTRLARGARTPHGIGGGVDFCPNRLGGPSSDPGMRLREIPGSRAKGPGVSTAVSSAGAGGTAGAGSAGSADGAPSAAKWPALIPQAWPGGGHPPPSRYPAGICRPVPD